jgi:hypothetical protein
MIAGRILSVDRYVDVVRLHVECNEAGCRHDVDVYPTPETVMVRPGDCVWSQSGKIMWTDSDRCCIDRVLWQVQQEEDGRRWTLEEAKQGSPAIQLPRKRPTGGGMACLAPVTSLSTLGLGWGWFLLVAAFLIGAVRERT